MTQTPIEAELAAWNQQLAALPLTEQGFLDRARHWGQHPLARYAPFGDFSGEVEFLYALPEEVACDLVWNALRTDPGNFYQFPWFLTNTPNCAVALAAVLIRVVYVWGADDLEDPLEQALPLLSLPLRALIFHRFSDLRKRHFLPGTDLDVIVGECTWRSDQDFPESSIAGVQARLGGLGFGGTDPIGEWGPSSEVAWMCFQLGYRGQFATCDNMPGRLGHVDDHARGILDGMWWAEHPEGRN